MPRSDVPQVIQRERSQTSRSRDFCSGDAVSSTAARSIERAEPRSSAVGVRASMRHARTRRGDPPLAPGGILPPRAQQDHRHAGHEHEGVYRHNGGRVRSDYCGSHLARRRGRTTSRDRAVVRAHHPGGCIPMHLGVSVALARVAVLGKWTTSRSRAGFACGAWESEPAFFSASRSSWRQRHHPTIGSAEPPAGSPSPSASRSWRRRFRFTSATRTAAPGAAARFQRSASTPVRKLGACRCSTRSARVPVAASPFNFYLLSGVTTRPPSLPVNASESFSRMPFTRT